MSDQVSGGGRGYVQGQMHPQPNRALGCGTPQHQPYWYVISPILLTQVLVVVNAHNPHRGPTTGTILLPFGVLYTIQNTSNGQLAAPFTVECCRNKGDVGGVITKF